MARTDQGIFKKLRKRFQELKEQYNSFLFMAKRAEEGKILFSDFAKMADDVYCEADSLIGEINGMLRATKFESNEKEKYYKDMESTIENMKWDTKSEFDRILFLIKQCGGLFDSEENELRGYRIYTV